MDFTPSPRAQELKQRVVAFLEEQDPSSAAWAVERLTLDQGEIVLARLRDDVAAAVVTRLDPARATLLVSGPVTPSAGDLLLARVERIGHHTKLQAPDGRRAPRLAHRPATSPAWP